MSAKGSQGPGADCSVEQLDPFYSYTDREAIARFARLCPALVPLLIEAAEQIGQYFTQPELVLEVVEGLSIEEQGLAVSINTDLAPEEAMARLERFDEEWWLDVQDQTEGRLCIDVEFR